MKLLLLRILLLLLLLLHFIFWWHYVDVWNGVVKLAQSVAIRYI